MAENTERVTIEDFKKDIRDCKDWTTHYIVCMPPRSEALLELLECAEKNDFSSIKSKCEKRISVIVGGYKESLEKSEQASKKRKQTGEELGLKGKTELELFSLYDKKALMEFAKKVDVFVSSSETKLQIAKKIVQQIS